MQATNSVSLINPFSGTRHQSTESSEQVRLVSQVRLDVTLIKMNKTLISLIKCGLRKNLYRVTEVALTAMNFEGVIPLIFEKFTWSKGSACRVIRTSRHLLTNDAVTLTQQEAHP